MKYLSVSTMDKLCTVSAIGILLITMFSSTVVACEDCGCQTTTTTEPECTTTTTEPQCTTTTTEPECTTTTTTIPDGTTTTTTTIPDGTTTTTTTIPDGTTTTTTTIPDGTTTTTTIPDGTTTTTTTIPDGTTTTTTIPDGTTTTTTTIPDGTTTTTTIYENGGDDGDGEKKHTTGLGQLGGCDLNGICEDFEDAEMCPSDCGEGAGAGNVTDGDGKDGDGMDGQGTDGDGMDLPDCNENWFCLDWEECVNGTRTRSCIDLNECGTEEEMPDVEESCAVGDLGITGFFASVSKSLIETILIFLLILLIILLIVRWLILR